MSEVAKQESAPAPKPSAVPVDFAMAGLQVTIICAVVIGLVTLWIYTPAMYGNWLWDDAMYLPGNRLLEEPNRVWKAWFQPGSFTEYYPLHQTFQWMQWALWGEHTFPYHLTNVLLHFVNALLVWRLLAKLGVRLAWIGGLLFAAHPVNVESVAWISEFKNCLSLAPALLAMGAWIDYVERRKTRDLVLCLVFFLVSMLCKIMMTMFPFVMLLYAWWRHGRIEKTEARASLIFLLVSVVLAGLTVYAAFTYVHRSHQGMSAILLGGPMARLALAGTTASFYFAQSFLPWDLLPVYPRWQVNPPLLAEILPWFGFGSALFWLWTKRAGWGRHALLGLGFFFINLAPFSGIHGISYMSFTWVMDHILYLPVIGVVGLVAAALGELNAKNRLIGVALAMVITSALAFRANAYVPAFTGQEMLWGYAVERNPGSWMVQSGMGKAVFGQGDPARAIPFFAAAASENPGLAEMHDDLGNALAQTGQVNAGIAEMQQALHLDPYDSTAHNNLGILLAREGKFADAIQHFTTSIRSQPNDPRAFDNMGNTYFASGRLNQAEDWYEQALKVDPRFPQARYNLGCLRLQQGKAGQAAADFEAAVQLKPDYLDARNNLGAALVQLGQVPDAITQFQIVLQIDPDNATAQADLAKLQGTPGPTR